MVLAFGKAGIAPPPPPPATWMIYALRSHDAVQTKSAAALPTIYLIVSMVFHTKILDHIFALLPPIVY